MLSCMAFNIEAKNTHSWGNISYTAYSNFNVTFNEQDFKFANFDKGSSFKIPTGVTHVNLVLPSNIRRVEVPDSVKFISKNIFKAGGLQHLIINQETAALICKKPKDSDIEVYVRRYFSLPDNCEISLRQTFLPKVDMGNNSGISNNVPTPPPLNIKGKDDSIPTPPPLNIKNKNNNTENKNQNFVDEINKYDRSKLKKVDEEDINKNKTTDLTDKTTNFIDELKSFKRENLRKVEENDLTSNREKEDDTPAVLKGIKSFDHNSLKHVEINKGKEKPVDDFTKHLRNAMEERRKDLSYDDEDNEENWDD